MKTLEDYGLKAGDKIRIISKQDSNAKFYNKVIVARNLYHLKTIEYDNYLIVSDTPCDENVTGFICVDARALDIGWEKAFKNQKIKVNNPDHVESVLNYIASLGYKKPNVNLNHAVWILAKENGFVGWSVSAIDEDKYYRDYSILDLSHLDPLLKKYEIGDFTYRNFNCRCVVQPINTETKKAKIARLEKELADMTDYIFSGICARCKCI